MSDAVPQYGFTVARRGYAPEQVNRALAALTAQRDEAWERLSVLGAGIRQMEDRLAEVRQAAEDAPAPDYTVLSEEAAGLAVMAENEARAVREKAERFAEDLREEVYEAGQAADRAAKEYAATTRSEADQAARRTEERTRAEAETIRGDADRDDRAARDAATAYAAKVRVASAEAGEQAETELAERRRSADEAFAEAQATAEAEDAEVAATAERRLKEAEQHRETVLGRIKQLETEAQAKADQLIEQARREAEKVNAVSEREQSEFAVRLETVQQHLDHIKATLASLTGAAVGQIEPASVAAAEPADAVQTDAVQTDPEAETGEIPVPDPRKRDVPAGAAATAALRLPSAQTGVPADAAPADAPVATGPVATGPVAPAVVPPMPVAPPRTDPAEAAAVGAVAADGEPEETRIIPKIVIVDDGSGYATPNTVAYRRR
ncbi:hypothetical protein ACWCXH_25735 [Kitasatospora sp. NPDC001660]